ncbi:MAG: restriction endonuclease [Anaerolineae bacterium]|nr:restriction endonuclease [Anaerolineae bacterium]
MAKQSYTSIMNAVAKQAAKSLREAEAHRKRELRLIEQQQRERTKQQKLLDKENKQQYLEGRIEEVEDLNRDTNQMLQQLRTVLEYTLSINDMIDFDTLRVADEPPTIYIPQILQTAATKPVKDHFTNRIKPPTLMERALGMARYKRETREAEELYDRAMEEHKNKEQERQLKIAELQRQHDADMAAFQQKVDQRNQEVDELKRSYMEGDISSINTYNTMVLERSEYPEGFPQSFRLAYLPESKELVIEYQLPDITVIPKVAEYKYAKSKDQIEEKPAKLTEIKALYQDIVAAVTLRTIHEVIEADQGNHLELVVFNGFVETVDLATGRDVKPHLVSVRVPKDRFLELNLARIDKLICLRNLGAQVSPQPEELQPIKPIVEFKMVDKRFVESGDVISDLESRPNLMDLNPIEFETLVSNLFQKMGLETRLTRSSRDGGVDVVAFDIRPVLGGKVVIQAKRYKNTVGVSAIRDLFGTMMNEGANKGIIVATSSYGKDAYEFSKDKPIELIDGGGLLFLLEQIGVQARIVIPNDNA